jgi:hypothetical protein
MAIERSSSKNQSPVVASSPMQAHLLLLWTRRWYILGVALVVAVLTYGAMWLVPEEFEASVAVYVNRMDVYDIQAINPNTVMSLAKNPELLRAVYDDFVAKFGVKPGDFEKFVKQFDVKSEILQDTTVKKEVSPVLELKVRFRGREQTRFLAESWVRHLVRKYGNVALDEAAVRADAMGKQDERLGNELRRLDAEKAQLESRLARDRKFYAEILDVLAPSDMPEALEPRQIAVDKNASNLQVMIHQPIPKPEGLLARYARLQLELDRLRAGLRAETTQTVEQLAAEEKVLSGSIVRLENQLQVLQESLARTQEALGTVTREYQLKRTEQEKLHAALDIYRSVAAARVSAEADGLPIASNVRAVSMPVMPELRVWPKRTLVAAGAAVAAVIFYALGLIAQVSFAGLVPRKQS